MIKVDFDSKACTKIERILLKNLAKLLNGSRLYLYSDNGEPLIWMDFPTDGVVYSKKKHAIINQRSITIPLSNLPFNHDFAERPTHCIVRYELYSYAGTKREQIAAGPISDFFGHIVAVSDQDALVINDFEFSIDIDKTVVDRVTVVDLSEYPDF